MTSIITRRSLLRGLFAMPAVVAASSLMPVRGIIQPIESFDIMLTRSVNLEQIRDFLLPGLMAIRHSYTELPRYWEDVFKDAA